MVFLLTDDPTYRSRYENNFNSAMQGGTLTFGPTQYDNDRAAGTSSCEGAWLKRQTFTKEAVIEFCVMALCDEFVGTAGSTVTFFVEAMNRRFNAKAFSSVTIIGDYDVPARPTMQFRQDVRNFIEKSFDHMRDTTEVTVTHEQQNVLDFLNDNHLYDMYDSLSTILIENNCVLPGARAGEIFLQRCKVASLNRKKFNEQAVTRAHNQHWFKALLKGRMKDYCSKTESIEFFIHMDDSHVLRLVPKGNSEEMGNDPSSSSAGESPMSKKRRFDPMP